MFCSKCGTQLNDDAVFCSACGNRVAQPQATPEQAAPVQAPTDNSNNYAINEPVNNANTSAPNKPANGAITIPSISGLISAGLALLMFIFMFLPWFKIEIFGYSKHFSIFTSDVFDVSTMLGIAKVLGIINIFVFVAYLVANFVDIKKFISAIPESIDLKKYTSFAFGGIYVLQWLFALIGALSFDFGGISICLIFALIFAAAFAVTVFKTDVVDNIVKNIKK